MAHSLSSHQIALLVGSQAFSRGERYARNGNVNRPEWFGSGTQLFGEVQGTRPLPYAVTVSFTTNAAGALVRASGVCTCPMKKNCKHVAALLIVSSATSLQGGTPAAEPARAIGDRRMPRFEPSVGPASPPPTPHWQRALAPLAHAAATNPATTAVGLQFELQDPGRDGRPAGGARPRRLAARPVIMGTKGKWIRGNLTWDNLVYVYGAYDPGQLAVLKALYALHSAGNRSHGYAQQWILLDGFATRAFWEILAEARTAGLALVTGAGGRDQVDVSPNPAALQLDIRRDSGALTLTPAVILAGRRLARTDFGFIGSTAHGVFTWTGVAGESGGNGESGVDRRQSALTLAPLERQLGAELRALAGSAEPLVVPDADESLFLADFYPFLRSKLTLTSTDGSFDLPESPRPRLALFVSHQPGARLELSWDWEYLTPDSETVLYRSPLRPAPGEARFRDPERENAILAAVGALLAGFPVLLQPQEHGAGPAGSAGIDGAAMIDFLARVVPELDAQADLRVTVSDDAPEYRAADEAPVISLGTTESTERRDWFDLAVTVSIDGEEIPFDDLFRALAADQDILILSSGTWFSLDRPELHQLRRLIEEARGLQDSAAESLGLNRFQADLWEELQALGVVSEQAAGWRSAVAGLTDADRIDRRPLPATVHAALRGYQQTGFDWLSFLYDHRLGGILADDMGLGKTLQAIALIAHARDQALAEAAGEAGAPFLVVAPTSVVSNWAAECARFAPALRIATITQTAVKRATSLAEVSRGTDIVVTSYTLFRLDFDDYNALEWSGLLLDEAQFVKNHQARAHQCARRLRTPFKLAITGTPMENNLMELWSLLSITAPGLFPNPGRFADYYRRPIETDADSDRLAQLRRRIRPFMLRRTKDQVAGDLPEKQEQVLELELHPKHRKVYDTHLARERQKVLGLIGDLNANRFEIFRSLTMLRQLSLDASLYDEKYAQVPSTKLDALLELLEDTVAEGHRTLIFSQFTQYLGKARARLDAAGIGYSYLDGKTRHRARAIDEFKDGTNPVFLISLKAGGFGLNLTEADYVILLDPWWNPATEAQAVDRVHRIGQTKHVMVYRLVAKDTIEEKVMALKATKARLFESVMTDAAPRGTALTAADIRELLS